MPRILSTTPRVGERFACPDCGVDVKPTNIGRSFMDGATRKTADIFMCQCKECDLKFYVTLEGPSQQ